LVHGLVDESVAELVVDLALAWAVVKVLQLVAELVVHSAVVLVAE